MKKKTLSIKCNSAFVVNGKIITPDQVVEDVPESDALNLIRRGKATAILDGEEAEAPALKDLTVAELKDVAEEHEIEGAAGMKKADLIEAIEAAEAVAK